MFHRTVHSLSSTYTSVIFTFHSFEVDNLPVKYWEKNGIDRLTPVKTAGLVPKFELIVVIVIIYNS